MLVNDIIYVSILLGCIGFGPIFRSIKNPNSKQWISTGVGIFVAIVVSGWHVAHPFLITIINALIISLAPRRIRHIASFFFSFFYLCIIFRFTDWYGVPSPPTHTNLILMMMTLRYGGLGYEINAAEEELKSDVDNENYNAITKVGFLDVIHYGFSYMGVLTGPFYRYRTYWDCINRNLGDYVDCWDITLYKLKLIVIASSLYLLADYSYPISYATSNEFLERSFLYRLWYTYPVLTTFRMRIFTGILFSECVCQMAGMGIYPTIAENRSGLGPKNYKAFMQIIADPNKLKSEPMDFNTIKNIDIWELEWSHSVRHSIKNWNTTVQYWLAKYVYKTFPYKPFRALAVFILSSLWHGYALGYYIAIFSTVFFLPVESIYIQFYENSKEGSIAKTGWWILLFCMRYSCQTYLSIAMLLLTYDNILIYYNSIYWCGYILAILLYIIGIALKPIFNPKLKKEIQ